MDQGVEDLIGLGLAVRSSSVPLSLWPPVPQVTSPARRQGCSLWLLGPCWSSRGPAAEWPPLAPLLGPLAGHERVVAPCQRVAGAGSAASQMSPPVTPSKAGRREAGGQQSAVTGRAVGDVKGGRLMDEDRCEDEGAEAAAATASASHHEPPMHVAGEILRVHLLEIPSLSKHMPHAP